MSIFDDDLDEIPVSAPDPDNRWGTGKGIDKTCGATWFGLRIEHCQMCHQTFSGSTTGDAHRVGPHDLPGQRRCLTAPELEGLGLWLETNAYGTAVWHGSPNKQGIQKRRPSQDRK